MSPNRIQMDEYAYSRFMERVEKTDDCWIWKGAKSRERNPYGRFSIGSESYAAHRVSYEHWVAKIPDGLQIDHLCRFTMCVNPNHLEPVTAAENRRRAGAAITHCKHGHEFTKENTKYFRGWRVCIKCDQIRWKIQDKERKAKRALRRHGITPATTGEEG